MCIFSWPAAAQDNADRFPVIPRPMSLTAAEGEFTISPATLLIANREAGEAKELLDFIREFLSVPLGGKAIRLKINEASGEPEANTIQLLIDKNSAIPAEGYQLQIRPDHILLKASSPAGAFWGFQTLRQLMPPSAENARVETLKVPCVTIEDAPRFSYRGLHLDVVRHMFPVEFIKKYIDLMSMYKLNRFHWHLTDDQGWRIEIKKYPKLQAISAFRKETLIGHYSDQPQKFDGDRYGGYYTQKEVKEIVEYARLHHVTVIPEIEMPGHSLAALSAYPELGCTGGPYETETTWGVFEDIFCAGNEETFHFLENVLTEVMELFPGKYLHIGGDEAPKTQWEKCPRCQARIQAEGLKDEHELQSYFIQRIEKFLNEHGRQIIGWDEILEGGLAPNATVMSWRGTEGGIAAARQGHDVIMTPNAHLYLDHYQSQSPGEPVAIGGFTPVKEVYEYEPVPEELSGADAKHILGAQGNLWTEYIPTTGHVEYMVYPRALALAEVVWSQAEKKNYDDFLERLKGSLERLSALDVNYAGHVFDVQAKAEAGAEGIMVNLWSADKEAEIRYTLDGSAPAASSEKYVQPINISSGLTLKAIRFRNGKARGKVFEQSYLAHKALGKAVELKEAPSDKYNPGGAPALVDGLPGSLRTADHWLGWNGKDMEAVIDLGKASLVNSISLHFGNSNSQWIYAPAAVEVLFSYDGYTFTPFYEKDGISSTEETVNITIPVGEENIRYIKVIARNAGEIPQGKPGAGHEAWLFADEIVVE
ncbi:family 20 glycosylhydrolase [Anseongella ginsenosidimutans]|nr:family 20 glycosylhydrolase [Anseongella ginsenosidimutans]